MNTLVGGLLALLLVSGCGENMSMRNQARYELYKESSLFSDGMASRPRIPGTLARGEYHPDSHFYEGKVHGQLATTLPLPLTRELLLRGRQRFNISCAACHGATGEGQGIIVQRGFPAPPSLHEQRLREAPIGHFFDVITHGFGRMPRYGPQIRTEDRWAIAAYLRALQLSQSARPTDLPPRVRELLQTQEEVRADEIH
jgi:hypothetical protein